MTAQYYINDTGDSMMAETVSHGHSAAPGPVLGGEGVSTANIYGYEEVTPTPVAHIGMGCDSLDRHTWHASATSSNSHRQQRRYRPQRRGSVTKFSIQAAQQVAQRHHDASFMMARSGYPSESTSMMTTTTAAAISAALSAAAPSDAMYHQRHHHHHQHQHQMMLNMNMPYSRRVSECSSDADSIMES